GGTETARPEVAWPRRLIPSGAPSEGGRPILPGRTSQGAGGVGPGHRVCERAATLHASPAPGRDARLPRRPPRGVGGSRWAGREQERGPVGALLRGSGVRAV